MLGKFTKKFAVGILTSALLIVTLVPTFASAYTYQGRIGHTFNDSNFYFNNTSVNAEQFLNTARFCWQTPEKYHEGFAVYLTEGDFHGGLNNYSPQFMSVGSNCATKYMPQGGKVSFRAYPYINLQSGARKYLQPGYKAELYVNVAPQPIPQPPKPTPQPMPIPFPQPPVFVDEAISLSITGWSGGSPKLDWTDYKGLEHGYKVIVAPGNLTKDQLLTKQGFYVGSQPSERQLSKLYANTTYSVAVVPYRLSHGTRRAILNAASNVLYFTTPANEPAPQMSCGDSSDGDGLYSACKGDTVHHSSGAKLKVVNYNDSYVQLNVSGAWPYNVYVFKNASKELQIKNGTRLKVTYTETSDKFGAFIRIETTHGPQVVPPSVGLPAVNLSVFAAQAGSAKLDWNDLPGLGNNFDKYHIKWSKGWVGNFDSVNHAKSYVSYGSYYNLGGLDSGWWSFQVVPTKNGVEVGNKSQIVRVYVQ